MRPSQSLAERRLADALARLEASDATSLEKGWRRAFGRTAPAGLTRTLLVRALAYKLQADALGDLDRDTARALDRMAGQGVEAEVMSVPDTRGSQRGTVLLREWQGTLHSVMVMGDGYAWNGVAYRSLSEVARAITGTRWNGPRFFGLRAAKGKTGQSEKRAAA